MIRIDRAILAPLLAGACLLPAPTLAAQPGDTRAGTIEVTVTYTGASNWAKGVERGSVAYDRKLSYRMPVIGHYAGASGWNEIDARLPPPIEGELPEQKATAADMETISAAFEAADAACGEDEDCLTQAMMGHAKRLQTEGKISVPKTMPKLNAPDLTRFLVLAPKDCATATATATIADRYEGVRIEGSEGGSGLRPYSYTEAGTETLKGGRSGAQHCRFNAVVDTTAGTYSLFVPIEARLVAKRSDMPDTTYDRQVTDTNGSVKLDARTRWLDLKLPAGGKVMSGRRVLDNVNGAGPDGTAVRAVVDWKLTLN